MTTRLAMLVLVSACVCGCQQNSDEPETQNPEVQNTDSGSGGDSQTTAPFCDLSEFQGGATAAAFWKNTDSKQSVAVWVTGQQMTGLDTLSCERSYHKTYLELCWDIYKCGGCWFELLHDPQSDYHKWSFVLTKFFKQSDTAPVIDLTSDSSCLPAYGNTYDILGPKSTTAPPTSKNNCGGCKICYDACSSGCTGMNVPPSCATGCMSGCDKCCTP